MILTVTPNPAVDHTLQLDEELTSGSVSRTDDAQYDPGGKGINVSKYLVGLGVETVATGFAGDFLGQFLTASLTGEGISNDFVKISGCTRLNTTVLTPEAEYKINQDGPVVDDIAVHEIVERIRAYDPETVVVAGSLPPGVGPEVVDEISTTGPWETVVDVGGEILGELDADYAICKPNREELAAATDESVGTVEECKAAARRLQSQGFERVVASLGADGVVMATSDAAVHVPALDVDVVDTVGAGDALLAGVLARHHFGSSDEAMLRTGVAVASRIVEVSGTGVPQLAGVLDEVEGASAEKRDSDCQNSSVSDPS